jgi:hypothetical protein
MSTQLDALSTENRGSRFAGQAADEKTVTHLASGGSLAPETRGLPEGWRTVERRSGSPQGGLAGVMRKALVLAVPLWAALPLYAEHVAYPKAGEQSNGVLEAPRAVWRASCARRSYLQYHCGPRFRWTQNTWPEAWVA